MLTSCQNAPYTYGLLIPLVKSIKTPWTVVELRGVNLKQVVEPQAARRCTSSPACQGIPDIAVGITDMLLPQFLLDVFLQPLYSMLYLCFQKTLNISESRRSAC